MINLSDKLEVLCPECGHVEGRKRHTIRSLRQRRSIRSFVVPGAVFVGLLICVLILNLAFMDASGWGRVLARSASVVPALFILNLVRIYFDQLYVFKPHVICHHRGILSLNYEMPVIYYSDVREIVVAQGLLGRLLNYGDVYLGTAATQGNEIHFRGVYQPRVIEQFVESMRRKRAKPAGSSPISPEAAAA